jgi:S1-C subfamily serine protease
MATMNRARRVLRTPFGSALLGGFVVAVVGAIAVSAGWIKSESDSTTTVAAPLAAPIASEGDQSGTDEGGGNVVNQIYKRDGGGVAFIESSIPPRETGTLSPFGEPETEGGGTATGSGFVIDGEGHVLTNNHVVENAGRIQVKLGASNATYKAEVVGADPASDLALLKVDAPADQLHPLTLGDSSQAEVGDPVVAIGNPFGLDRTVTSGIVSALQRQIQAPNGFSITNVIQTDAAINPGNSGGPLINTSGEVIGINSQIATGGGGGGNVGIGFAIPINTARAEIHQLETKGEVDHAYLGITGGTITPELARAVNLPVTEGVIVQTAVKGGPADKAGIEGGTTSATINGTQIRLGGDIITELNGKKVSGMDDVISLINRSEPGEEVELTILRDGKTKTVTLTLGTRPDSVEEQGSE